jgi:hypothetical protein
MIKFRKGDKVIRFDACGDGRMFIREFTVQSWGAKRGTVSHIETGKYLEEQIYVELANDMQRSAFPQFYFLSGSIDVAQTARDLSTQYIDREVSRLVNSIALQPNANPAYLKKLRDTVAAFTAQRDANPVHPDSTVAV